MIQLPQGFKVASAEAIDVRLILSKAEMLTMKDGTMPEVYFAICKDDGKMYVYQKTNEVDEETGKYRLYASGNSDAVDPSTVESIISKKDGNAIIAEEDGMYVEDAKPIDAIIIQDLFSEKDENK